MDSEFVAGVKEGIRPIIDAVGIMYSEMEEAGLTKQIASFYSHMFKDLIKEGFTPKQAMDLLVKLDFTNFNKK